MENAKNRDPLSRPCKSTQTTKRPIESRGVPPSEFSTSSVEFSNRFYFPASSKRVSTGFGGSGASGYRKTSLEPGQNDNYSSSMLRDKDERTSGRPLRRVQPNNSCSVSRRDRPTCICFLQRRVGKATQTPLSPEITKKTQEFARDNIISQEASSSNPVSKKNCGRCYAQRGTAINEPESGTMIEFYKTYEKTESRGSTAPINPESNFTAKKLPNRVLSKDLSPKDVMNKWVPSREGPVESLLPPNENYIDVSTRDFSLRKYFPELFLSEAEKNEIRAKEQEELQEGLQEEDTAASQKDPCRGKKCSQGKCNSEEKESFKDWRTVIELGSPIRTPCPWSDEGTILAPDVPDKDREEEIGGESNIQLAPEQRPRGWLRWSCGKFKRGNNKEKKNSNGKQN